MTGFVPTSSVFSLRRNIAVGGVAAVLLVTLVGGWAFATNLSGAVIAQGILVVDSNVKKIQHPTGGVVGELLVKDGSVVKTGDVLVRLDDTQTRANLAILTKQLDELAARQAREEAERDDAETTPFPPDLEARSGDPDVARLMAGERRLFGIRKAARDGQKSQLQDEIAGIEVQRDARMLQIEWIKKELIGVNELWEKNLVPYTRVTALEREAARLEGERGQLISSIAQARGKIAEVDQDMRAEVGKDLGDIRGKTSELLERKVAAEDQLRRVEMRSPIGGTVYQSSVHTVGGVITPGEQIMLVVPKDDALIVEAKIPPQDIDQVRMAQTAFLKFTSFNQRTTPETDGEVSMVAADVSQDPKTGTYFYTIRISIPAGEIPKLEGLKLVAGMPVEVFIKTSDRTVISYLARPLVDQITRAFREK
jgi:HlyD family secretion protein